MLESLGVEETDESIAITLLHNIKAESKLRHKQDSRALDIAVSKTISQLKTDGTEAGGAEAGGAEAGGGGAEVPPPGFHWSNNGTVLLSDDPPPVGQSGMTLGGSSSENED